MKHNSVWGKLLLLALSFVLAFSTLVSCTKDDIAALDKENDEIKTELGTTEENLAKLETLVNSIKVTADAAATKDALEAAKTALEAVKTTADAAATAAKLEEVKTALEAALAGKADSAVKAELEAAIAAVKTTADAAATAAKLEEAKTALEAAIAGKADKAALEEAAAKIAALEEDAADLAEVTAALKTALEGKATKTELAAVEAKLADYAKAADVVTLQNTLNETKAKVEEVATDLSALLAEFNALKATTTGLEAELAAAQAAIAALQADDFAAEYKAATETLYVDSEGNDYSLKDWDDLVASVDDELYTSGTYTQFVKKAETLRFFLNRALTVEEIKGYFAELIDYKTNEMETFEQTLEKIVLSYECGGKFLALDKDTAATMTEMDEAYVGATNVGLEDATLAGRYAKIAAAYDNLEAAEAASESIEALIATVKGIETIVYEDSKEAISNAVDAFNIFEHTFFQANAQYLEYYEAKTTTALAAALVKDYADMVAAEARYYELCDAWDNRVVLSQVALGYYTARPTYDKAESLAAELAAVNAWIAEYELEEVNVAKMYYDEYALINAASTYANAMAKIYTDLGVAALNARIEALNDTEDNVLYNSLAEAEAIVELVEELEDAIVEVKDFANDLDNNFLAMITEYSELRDTCQRLATLINAVEAVEDIAEDIKAFWNETEAKYVVGFSDYDTIKAIEAAILKVLTDYNIVVSDVENSNYVLIVAATQADYDELFEAYEELTAELRAAYNQAIAILDSEEYNAEYPIPYANKSIEAIQIVANAITKYGVANADIKLPGTVDGEVEVNFTTLLLRLSAVATNIASKAAAAETAYASVNTLIAKMKDLDAKMLDNKAAIDAAYNAIVEWAVEYLGVAEDATDAEIQAAVDAVQGMMKYDGAKNDKAFVLLTSADCAMVIVAKDTAKATYDAAEAEWETLLVEIDRLTAMTNGETYSIHTKDAFAAGEKAYNDYRAKYYLANSIVYLFDEDVEKDEFDDTYAAFNIFYGEAEDALEAIKDEFAKLPTDLADYKDLAKAQAALADANKVIELINAFNARFDKDHIQNPCNAWFTDVDGKNLVLEANKAKNMALTMIAVITSNVNTTEYVDYIHSLYVVQIISNVTSVADAETYYGLAVTEIQAKEAELQAVLV